MCCGDLEREQGARRKILHQSLEFANGASRECCGKTFFQLLDLQAAIGAMRLQRIRDSGALGVRRARLRRCTTHRRVVGRPDRMLLGVVHANANPNETGSTAGSPTTLTMWPDPARAAARDRPRESRRHLHHCRVSIHGPALAHSEATRWIDNGHRPGGRLWISIDTPVAPKLLASPFHAIQSCGWCVELADGDRELSASRRSELPVDLAGVLPRA